MLSHRQFCRARIRLEQDREDRAPRLQKLLFEATTAQDDLNIAQVIARWDALATQKDAAHVLVEHLTRELHHAWREVFRLHRLNEQEFQRLPRAGSSFTAFPSDTEFATRIAGRLPAGYGAMVLDACQGVLPIKWADVRETDAGLKRLEASWVGRVRDVAHAWRLKMAQQTEIASDEAEDQDE